MRYAYLIVGIVSVPLGVATVLMLATPDHPFYGFAPHIALYYDEEAQDAGEPAVMDHRAEPMDRFLYGILGAALLIGGAMALEAHRYGGHG